MSTPTAVVVTGLGALLGMGAGREALGVALAAGTVGSARIDAKEGLHAADSARTAVLIGPVDWSRWISPAEARRMSPPARFAVVAARLAVEDAGFATSPEPDPTLSIALSTAFGPSSYTQRVLDQILDDGPATVSPALFTECVANAPASRVGLTLRARGPQHTIVAGEAGPLRALARGAADVKAGRARAAFVGAAEEITPLVHAILDRFRALSRPGADGVEQGRPFDRERNGFIAAEGAVVLVLESEADARRRDATVLARVLGTTAAFDPSAPASGWGTGVDTLALELRRGMDRHGLAPEDIDLVVSGASGSRAGDRLEARVLRRVWGERPLPPVVAPKATVGEHGGGFLAAAILAANGQSFAPTPGFRFEDPELGIRPHDGSETGVVRKVLVTTVAAGGAASWIFLERP